MGQLVHRVRLNDVHAKLAMRRGGKRQNQVSNMIHQEVIHYQKSSSRSEVRGPSILSSPGPHKGIRKEIAQPNPENVNPAAVSEDSLQLHTSHIRLWVEQIQQPSWSYIPRAWSTVVMITASNPNVKNQKHKFHNPL